MAEKNFVAPSIHEHYVYGLIWRAIDFHGRKATIDPVVDTQVSPGNFTMLRRASTRIQIPVVELAIVFDDGTTMVFPIEWRNGMTAFDALKRASQKDHGVAFDKTGTGPTAFVTEIGGLPNSMTGYRANWKYSVNGQEAKVSCGVYRLNPSDIVRWEYVPYREEFPES